MFIKILIQVIKLINLQFIKLYHNEENLERYKPNKNGRGGQSGTYLRQTIGVIGSAGEHRKM